MKKIKNIFERRYRSDRIDAFEENTNVFKSISDVNKVTVEGMADNEPAVYDDKMVVKVNGAIKELVIDSGSIILKEI